jgi:acetyl-CoA acetyltransferase
MAKYELRNKNAIVGIGATEFSKNSGRSETQLAVEAVTTALADAGVKPSDVDGFSTFTMDNSSEIEVARLIGAGELTFFSRINFGGHGACAPIMQAALAIHAGVAQVIVCYRAMNERSEYRFGSPVAPSVPTSENAIIAFHSNQGLSTPGASMAMSMRRYMYETGARSEDFAHLAVTQRRHASTNPKAFFYGKPIAIHDYMNARIIVDPFRLLDFCQESDGAVAVVVTSADRAGSLNQKPVFIRAAAQGATRGQMSLTNYYRDDIVPREEVEIVARQLYAMAGLGAKDIDGAIIYDHFLPSVLPGIEAYGFCKPGEAKDFIKDGNVGLGGTLPINTHGGQVGEAYIHGMNGIAEAVRQVRGTAANQIQGLENIVVTAGSGGPTSGLILGAA